MARLSGGAVGVGGKIRLGTPATATNKKETGLVKPAYGKPQALNGVGDGTKPGPRGAVGRQVGRSVLGGARQGVGAKGSLARRGTLSTKERMGSRPVSRASVRAGQEGGRKVQPPRRNGKGLRPGDTGRLMNGGPTSKENTGGLHGVGRLLKGQKGNPRNVVKQQSGGKGRKVSVQPCC